MRTLFLTAAAVVLFAGSALAGELVNVAGASGIALDGYDAVAFFTDHAPVHGTPDFTATYQGATYLFASAAHRDRFAADPKRYAPEFGGYCAYGVANGALFPVDVSTWQVRDGKLYLNINPTVLKAFNADLAGNIQKAAKNWPALTAKYAK